MNLRKIGRINLPNLEPNAVSGAVPECVMVDPSALYVEEQYQRNLADKSIKLIRRMVRTWNWAHMKPPICVRSGDKLFVVDGQHTAIAAAILAGDPVQARQAVSEHLEGTSALLRGFLT